MNRMGKRKDIANAFLFLACDATSFCTGSMLIVDSGTMAQ
jgi:NAD(P)-dependent dehydrogenase (short-subunit alcohol dehydrogenase family)